MAAVGGNVAFAPSEPEYSSLGRAEGEGCFEAVRGLDGEGVGRMGLALNERERLIHSLDVRHAACSAQDAMHSIASACMCRTTGLMEWRWRGGARV